MTTVITSNMDSFFSTIFENSHKLREDLEKSENKQQTLQNLRKNQAIDSLIYLVTTNYEQKIKMASNTGKTRVALFTNIRKQNKKIEGFYLSWIMKQPEFLQKLKDIFNPFTVYIKKFRHENRNDDQNNENNITEDNNNYVNIFSDVIFVSWFKDNREN